MAPFPSMPNKPGISLMSTDEDVVARVAELFRIKYHLSCPARYERKGWKPAYHVILRGHRAAEMMRLLQPLMGKRRQGQIDRALATYKLKRKPLIDERTGLKIARRYFAGERHPTALGREFGISKNLAIHYINKYAAVAQG